MAERNPEQQPKADAEPGNPEPATEKAAVPRVTKKIPEPPRNLRRREEWFRKRSGA